MPELSHRLPASGSFGGQTGSPILREVTPARSHGCRRCTSTQAPHIDVGISGTDTATVNHNRLRWMVRQLNTFTRRQLLLGRFEVLGPRHRRQGGAPSYACGPMPHMRTSYRILSCSPRVS